MVYMGRAHNIYGHLFIEIASKQYQANVITTAFRHAPAAPIDTHLPVHVGLQGDAGVTSVSGAGQLRPRGGHILSVHVKAAEISCNQNKEMHRILILLSCRLLVLHEVLNVTTDGTGEEPVKL